MELFGRPVRWFHLVLVLLLLFGIYLRAYHADYPLVGYHNWKEAHYLTEARNFAREGFFTHGFFIPEWDYPSLRDQDPSGAHSDTFPVTPIVTAVLFWFFGEDLGVARFGSIFFAVGSILFMYLIVKHLFKREDLALASAAVLSFNPLLVFFGRQVDVINPALFFSLMGIYFYLKWIDNFSWGNTLLFSTSLFLGIITKYYFAAYLIPLAVIFPFSKIKERTLWMKYGCVVLWGLLFASWIPYSSKVSGNIGAQLSAISFSLIFEGSFWDIMKSYVSDNFTLWGIFVSFAGLVLFLLNFKKNKQDVGYRFFLALFISSLPLFLVMAKKLSGHNYHQYVFLPLIGFFIAYAFVGVSSTIAGFLKEDKQKFFLRWGLIALFCLLLYFPSVEAKNRMFDTQFFGTDIAGEFVRDHKLPGERAFHSSHQAYGFLWHGDIKGTRGVPNAVEDFRYGEENLNVRWLFIYQWDFDTFQDEQLLRYIEQNYQLRQTAFIQQNGQIQPLYFLFEKGGTFSMSSLNDLLQDEPISSKTYETSRGNVVVQFVTLSS